MRNPIEARTSTHHPGPNHRQRIERSDLPPHPSSYSSCTSPSPSRPPHPIRTVLLGLEKHIKVLVGSLGPEDVTVYHEGVAGLHLRVCRLGGFAFAFRGVLRAVRVLE